MTYRTRAILILSAITAAVAPLPSAWVERLYSRGVYPILQQAITPVSNLVPVALLDIASVLPLAFFTVTVVRDLRMRGPRTAVRRALLRLVTAAAAVYLLFLASWGLQYRRVPLQEKLDFDGSRVSEESARQLATVAIERLNAGYAAAHAQPYRLEALERAFEEAQTTLGATRLAVPGRPKRSLAGLYFRYAAVDGMTVPVFLEIILNPDLLPIERPSVLVHEWAHLAGYADESEANFVSWLAGVRSTDPVAQYSAWMDAYRLAAGALPRQTRASLPSLDAGPRADFRAIAARYARSSPAVRTAARGVYDSYLKANRVEAGIESYELALQLMLGTSAARDLLRRHREAKFAPESTRRGVIGATGIGGSRTGSGTALHDRRTPGDPPGPAREELPLRRTARTADHVG